MEGVGKMKGVGKDGREVGIVESEGEREGKRNKREGEVKGGRQEKLKGGWGSKRERNGGRKGNTRKQKINLE